MDLRSATVFEIERRWDEVQTDTRHENGGNRNERYIDAWPGRLNCHDCALIFAEQFLDAFERDRIDVPGISGNVSHTADAAVTRCMKAMIHTRTQTQRDELAAPMTF